MRDYFKLLLFSLVMMILVDKAFAQGDPPGSATPGSAVIHGEARMEGVPVPGAQISLYLVSALHGQSSLIQQCMTWTDEKGLYSCSFLPEGDYLIALEGYGRRRTPNPRALPISVLFPGTMDPDRSVLVSVRQKDQQEASFELGASSVGYKVSGILPAGYHDGTLSLYIRSEQGFSYRLPATPKITKEGEFTFDRVPPGNYQLRGRQLVGRTEYDSTTPVQVRSRDLSNIRVVFSSQGTSDLIAALPFGLESSHVSVSMVDMETGHRAQVDGSDAPRYKLSELVSGEYWISIVDEKETNSCVASIQVDGRETELPLKFDQGIPVAQINVSTSPDCFSITGRVESHHAAVVVVTDERLRVIGTTHADATGAFLLGGLRTGNYRLFAWSTINGVAYRSHELLTKHLKDSVPIELSDGEQDRSISLATINN